MEYGAQGPATGPQGSTRAAPPPPTAAVRRAGRRGVTETKQAFKTTEFWAYVGVLLALLIAGLVADGLGGPTTSGSTRCC